MEAAEAAGLVARAAVEMTGALTKKSSGALRQQRYRERNKPSQRDASDRDESVTNRNESVTRYAEEKSSQTVTSRNESVTSDDGSLYKKEKKEEKEKKERAAKRAASLPDDWQPDEKHWLESIEVLGSADRARLELRKFQLHAADKGRLAKNWNAAWVKWSLQAVEYGSRNGGGNGQRTSNTRKTGHDAILAAASRAAREEFGDGEMAGPAGEAEFSFGDGAFGSRPTGTQRSADRAQTDHHGREPFGGPVFEGEIISPDETAAGLSDSWRRH
jgi:hypothetical protein